MADRCVHSEEKAELEGGFGLSTATGVLGSCLARLPLLCALPNDTDDGEDWSTLRCYHLEDVLCGAAFICLPVFPLGKWDSFLKITSKL